MLPEERIDDPEEALRQALDGRQADIWTAMPGIIQSFDSDAITAEVQPALQYNMRQKDGKVKLVTLPLLVDCPVHFIGGGGFLLTFPVAAGDECLVVFSQRCIDSWWQNGGVQPPAEFRMHDPSDGMVIPGFYSQPTAQNITGGIRSAVVDLRSFDNTIRVSLHTNSVIQLANSNGSYQLNPDGSSTISGNLTVGGTLTFGDGNRKIALDGDAVTSGHVVASGTDGLGS